MAYRKAPGKFLADWFDASGRRLRKQFGTLQAAHRFEHEQTALAIAERCGKELRNALHHTHRKRPAMKALIREATRRIEEAATRRD